MENFKKYEWLIAGLLLLAIFLIRFNKLEADPPIGLSASTDVYTDHAQYTLFAKQKVMFGDFNPLDDNRFVFFLKSTVTVLSLVVFKLFGVSLFSNNLIGLLFSFGALFCFYLIIRKAASWGAGIIYLLLIALDYNLVFFGKLPFLEHAMAFWGFLALVLVLYQPKWYGYILGGLSLGLAIFFSKVIGLVFLFPFFCYFAYIFFFEDKNKNYKNPLIFIAGFGAVVLFWLFFSYLPAQSQVSGYVGEQAISLYGAPEAFDSVGDFFWKMITFGEDSHLFGRMILPSLLSLFFIGAVLNRLVNRIRSKKGKSDLNATQIFIVAVIIGFFFSLMIWNYRPLRYQLVLIYPFYGAAAIFMANLWNSVKNKTKDSFSYLSLPIIYLLVLIPGFQLTSYIVKQTIGQLVFEDFRILIIMGTIVLTLLIFAALRFSFHKKLALPQTAGWVVVIVIFGLVYFKSVSDYLYWNERATFTARDTGKDIGKILSPSAILSGPYANLLAFGNENKTIIHMFGVSEADPELFIKYPITHLLLDEANEVRAKEDYPVLMDSAAHILTYHVGLKKVRLYRVAGYTGNTRSDSYHLSKFERLVEAYHVDNRNLVNQLALEILDETPDNISCYEFFGEMMDKDSVYTLADAMLKKAVEFSPTNYNLMARLGIFYENWYKVTNQRNLADSALAYYDKAIKFAPTVMRLYNAREELRQKIKEK